MTIRDLVNEKGVGTTNAFSMINGPINEAIYL